MRFLAIGSLVLLLLTFMVGIRCFADFDQGLREAKTDGQSYIPVMTQLPDLFGDLHFASRSHPQWQILTWFAFPREGHNVRATVIVYRRVADVTEIID